MGDGPVQQSLFERIEHGNTDGSFIAGSGQHDVAVALLRESGLNHRKTFDKQKMEELVASVKVHGVLENLILRPVKCVSPNAGDEAGEVSSTR